MKLLGTKLINWLESWICIRPFLLFHIFATNTKNCFISRFYLREMTKITNCLFSQSVTLYLMLSTFVASKENTLSQSLMSSGFLIVQPLFECLVLAFLVWRMGFLVREGTPVCEEIWGISPAPSTTVSSTTNIHIDYQAIIALPILCTVCLSTLVSNGAFTWT